MNESVNEGSACSCSVFGDTSPCDVAVTVAETEEDAASEDIEAQIWLAGILSESGRHRHRTNQNIDSKAYCRTE